MKIQTDPLPCSHRTIKAVTGDVKRFSYNTALARIMELLNHMARHAVRHRSVVEAAVKLLSPFAPYLAEELWEQLGQELSISDETWPVYSEEHTMKQTVTFIVQVNGKMRASLPMDRGMAEKDIEARVMADPMVTKWIKDREIVRKIFVPDRLVNIVVK
ncbi:MAG: class I tRNA ligase family protein [Desulfobacterales bacterium]